MRARQQQQHLNGSSAEPLAPPDFIPTSARGLPTDPAPAPAAAPAPAPPAGEELGTGELHPGWADGGMPLLVRVYLSPARRTGPVEQVSDAENAHRHENVAAPPRVVAVRFVKTFSR